MLNEPLHVCAWLVAGSERAVLLDSGLGIAPIRPVAERLARRPVDLITTHYHFDHVGGHHEFADCAIHEAGVAALAAGPPDEVLRGYGRFVNERDRQAQAYIELDSNWFALMSVDTIPRPLPAGFDFTDWHTSGATATQVLHEGDAIDLGGRTLTVLHTPGHSPDGISLLEERTGILFVGDQFNPGPVYAHFPDSDVTALAQTARRLAELGHDSVRAICSHHYPRVLGETTLLGEFAECVERVVDGETGFQETYDIVGNTVGIALFDRFAVTVALPDHPTTALHNPLS